jgi:hypothetical protein
LDGSKLKLWETMANLDSSKSASFSIVGTVRERKKFISLNLIISAPAASKKEKTSTLFITINFFKCSKWNSYDIRAGGDLNP